MTQTLTPDADDQPPRRLTSPRSASLSQFRSGSNPLRLLDTGACGTANIVCLHGLANSIEWWFAVVDELSRREYRVLAFDIPGFGESARPRKGVTIDVAIKAAVDLVASVEGPVVVVGHSMGGLVAVELAQAIPDRVVGLVLIGAAVDRATELLHVSKRTLSSSARVLAAQALVGMFALPHAFARSLLAPAPVRGVLMAPFVDRPRAFPAGLAADLAACPRDARSTLEALALARRHRLDEAVARSVVPITLMCGSNDRLAPPSAQLELAEATAVVGDIVIEQCGHWPQLERPRVTGEVIAQAAHTHLSR